MQTGFREKEGRCERPAASDKWKSCKLTYAFTIYYQELDKDALIQENTDLYYICIISTTVRDFFIPLHTTQTIQNSIFFYTVNFLSSL